MTYDLQQGEVRSRAVIFSVLDVVGLSGSHLFRGVYSITPQTGYLSGQRFYSTDYSPAFLILNLHSLLDVTRWDNLASVCCSVGFRNRLD